MYIMQASPCPPNAGSFQRSGSTANCCQRCWSVEPSRDCGVMKFVSGHIANGRPVGLMKKPLRKKYCTCEPGVSRPSAMIFVNSFVVALPSQPVRDCGTVVSHAGSTPLQCTLLSVGELVGDFVVSSTKHLNLLTPSVANFGSSSWIVVMYRPRMRPVVVTSLTGEMFSSVLS